ncbi:phage head closure protein [Eubacteriales bacterium OttesenSCG-928-M02]|nr:phage head closure protein [Eubacteriales bacterium OttesenSCG-928-M02]
MKLKDKKIEIFKQLVTRDKYGVSTTTLEPIAPPIWAYYRQLSGKEVFAAASTHSVEEVLFVINWRDNITTRHIVRFRGADYDITRIDTFEGYKSDLTLYAKRRG